MNTEFINSLVKDEMKIDEWINFYKQNNCSFAATSDYLDKLNIGKNIKYKIMSICFTKELESLRTN